jgi:hypothetical protein
MCGATGAQNQLQQEDMSTLQDYNSMLQQQYANQGAIFSKVSSVLDPILNAGPNQKGFSTAESNTLNAQAVEGTAENYAGAAKAVGEQTAAEGGGNNPLPSGAQTQLKQQVANSAAETESGEETQIAEQDYETGRQNFQNAEQGEMAIASGEDPLGYAGAVTSSEGAAGTEANQIAEENNSWYNAAIGAAGSIGSAVVSENPGDIFGG